MLLAPGRRWMSAADLTVIERALAVVEANLCETFPDDFYRRCPFAAFGLRALLRDAGMDAVLVGGQFAAFVMAPDGGRLAVQGFRTGPEPHPHYWVEADDRLVDLGPHLLAFGSDYPIVGMPAIAWDMSAPLPSSFRYKAQQRYPADSRMSIDAMLCAQSDAFIESCRAMAADPGTAPKLPTWLATSYASLIAAVEREDPWACGARRFEQMADNHPMPF